MTTETATGLDMGHTRGGECWCKPVIGYEGGPNGPAVYVHRNVPRPSGSGPAQSGADDPVRSAAPADVAYVLTPFRSDLTYKALPYDPDPSDGSETHTEGEPA